MKSLETTDLNLRVEYQQKSNDNTVTSTDLMIEIKDW